MWSTVPSDRAPFPVVRVGEERALYGCRGGGLQRMQAGSERKISLLGHAGNVGVAESKSGTSPLIDDNAFKLKRAQRCISGRQKTEI